MMNMASGGMVGGTVQGAYQNAGVTAHDLNNKGNNASAGNAVVGNAPKFCPECGTPTNGAKFCSNCGTKLQ